MFFDQYNIKTIQKITTHSKDLHVKFLFIRRVPVSVTSVSYGPRRGLGESWLRHAQLSIWLLYEGRKIYIIYLHAFFAIIRIAYGDSGGI